MVCVTPFLPMLLCTHFYQCLYVRKLGKAFSILVYTYTWTQETVGEKQKFMLKGIETQSPFCKKKICTYNEDICNY